MFGLSEEKVFLTRFHGKAKYLPIIQKYLNFKQKQFIDMYWYSIDAIKIQYNNNNNNNNTSQVILYEIKTKNKYNTELNYKPKMTKATHEMYNYAKELGFITKLVTIFFHENWNFSIEIIDFDEKYYCIDKPKCYDRNTNIC